MRTDSDGDYQVYRRRITNSDDQEAGADLVAKPGTSTPGSALQDAAATSQDLPRKIFYRAAYKWGSGITTRTSRFAQGSVAEWALRPDSQRFEKCGLCGCMEFFHTSGAKIGEDKFVAADAAGSGFGSVMSPEAANARIKLSRQIRAERQYANGDAALRAEMDNCHKMLSRRRDPTVT